MCENLSSQNFRSFGQLKICLVNSPMKLKSCKRALKSSKRWIDRSNVENVFNASMNTKIIIQTKFRFGISMLENLYLPNFSSFGQHEILSLNSPSSSKSVIGTQNRSFNVQELLLLLKSSLSRRIRFLHLNIDLNSLKRIHRKIVIGLISLKIIKKHQKAFMASKRFRASKNVLWC